MIELALAWQAMAGVMINAMTITILHVLSRISMVLAGSKYFYSSGCVVYIMFAMLLVYHVTSSQWPTLKPRQIVRKKLSSVLPQWLYSGALRELFAVDLRSMESFRRTFTESNS